MTFARQALNAVLPKGSAWIPKYNGGMDRLYNGIADCFEILQQAGAALAKMRHPLETEQLDDLEREFGILPETTTTEAQRRAYLDGLVYGPLATGSADDLESRLRLAGFDVRVHQNQPVTDPDMYLASIPAASCGDPLSSCGAPLVSCSRSDDGSGSLLVNERQESDAKNRLVDGDMEATGVDAWTASNSATLTKQAGAYSGAQCLRIAFNGTNEPGAYQTGIIRPGIRYRITGFAKGDGTFYPAVSHDVVPLWQGTTAAAWQAFEATFISQGNAILLLTNANAAGFVEFDDVKVTRIGAEYTVPDDSRYWPLIFFVGGEKTGDDFFDDWNMEKGHTGDWTPGGGALLNKILQPVNDGIRSLQIRNTGGITDQQIQPLNPDSDMVAFYRMDDVAGTVENLAWFNELLDGNCEKQNGTDVIVDGDMEVTGPDVIVDGDMEVTGPDVIVDGDMEAVGVGSWTAGNSATLTKDVTDPHAGSQALRIVRNGVNNPYAAQTILTATKTYRIKGWARGDGATGVPYVKDSAGTTLWTGTSSTSYQEFDFVYVAAVTALWFWSGATAGTDFVQFDDIEVIDETVACAAWSVGGGALLSKQENAYEGSQCLRVEYDGTSYPRAEQVILTIGKTYRVKGVARSDGSAAYPVVKDNIGGNNWTGTTSTSWQPFDFVFVADGTTLFFRAYTTVAGYCEFDDVEVTDETVACAAYTKSAQAMISKQNAAYEGSQCLRVERLSAGPTCLAYQTILTAGNVYRLKGAARSDGVLTPQLVDSGANILWTGGTSGAWEEFDFTFTAAGTQVQFKIPGATGAIGDYIEFDGLYVIDMTDSCDEWTANGDAVGAKILDEDPVTGNQFLRITNGPLGGYLDQAVMTPANDYTLHGWARGDGTAAPRVQDGAVVLWTGTTSTTWQEIDISFTAANADLRLYATVVSQSADFDDLLLNDVSTGSPALAIDAANANGVDVGTPWIKGIEFDGASAVVTATPTNPKVFGHEQLTICGWFYFNTGAPAIQGLVTNGSNGVDLQRLIESAGVISFSDYVGGVLTTVSTSDFDLEEWRTHVCVTRRFDGVETTTKLYVGGVEKDTDTSTGAPDVTLTTALIGYYNAARYFDGVISDNVSFFTAEKSAAWVLEEYNRGLVALYAGPYAEQSLDTVVTGALTFRGAAFSIYDAAGSTSGIPMVYIKNASGEWEILWVGQDAAGAGLGVQAISEALADGIETVRMYNKGVVGDAAVAFDTIRIDDIEIARATVPATQRKKFERLILQTKPEHSWAGLLIDFA